MLNTAQLNKLTSIRKTFHAHPEVSEHELLTRLPQGIPRFITQ